MKQLEVTPYVVKVLRHVYFEKKKNLKLKYSSHKAPFIRSSTTRLSEGRNF